MRVIPVCSACQVGMRVAFMGVIVVEHSLAHGPYRLWNADEYECRKCGVKVISSFGEQPFAQRHEESFQATLARLDGNERVRHEYERVP